MTESSVQSLDAAEEIGDDGPLQLAERLLEKRRKLGTQGLAAWLFGDLTESELIALIRICFRLSFLQDEGRYPSITIVVPTRQEKHLLEAASVVFTPPIPLSARTLRRLSPAVPARPLGLLVRGTADGLMCLGVGRFETAGAMLPEDQTGRYVGSDGLVVEVSGPGEITVHEANDVYSLRAGTIERQLNGNRALDAMPGFSAVQDATITDALGQTTERLKTKMAETVKDGWMYVLKQSVEMAHGGAFGILPTENPIASKLPDGWRDKLSFTYPLTEPDMLGVIKRYVKARWGDDPLARHTALQYMTDAADCVAHLSATDGFVILNANLRCLGFGVKVRWGGEGSDTPRNCVEVDEKLQPTGGLFSLARAGMRHTAGYMLAQMIPGAFSFVVSQDGQLRVFFQNAEGETQVTAPLAPVTYLFQGV